VGAQRGLTFIQDGKHFFDITNHPNLARLGIERRRTAVVYPAAMAQTVAVNALLPSLSKTIMQNNLQTFSDFQNRYYKSAYGKNSSEWLLAQVQDVIAKSNVTGVSVRAFSHPWGQASVIATIPGKSVKIIAVGAHQDSINLSNPMNGRAPGAGK
jgi:bacterial leucyl aminopeptidase